MMARFVMWTVAMMGWWACHAGTGGGDEGGSDVPDTSAQDPGEGMDVTPDAGDERGTGVDVASHLDADAGACPVEAPISGACTADGLRCEYGTECCCGQCHPSLVCVCHGGSFACYYTEACMIPECPDAADAVDAKDPADTEVDDAGDPGDSGGGQDAGMVVQCATSPPVFPAFDESCEDDQDCGVVFHQVNCCGTEVAWGIAASAQAAFEAAEAECRAQFPACGCPASPTEAEDGNTADDPARFAVSCKEGRCFSYVEGAAPRCHDANDCEAGQICLAPGESPPCGICRAPEPACEKDADCGPGEVCEWKTGPCLCWPAMQCVVRCDLPFASILPPCRPGEACVDGHCVAQACIADQDCPFLFECDVAEKTCSRRTCQDDEDCLGGRCVNHACHGSLGTCSYIPP